MKRRTFIAGIAGGSAALAVAACAPGATGGPSTGAAPAGEKPRIGGTLTMALSSATTSTIDPINSLNTGNPITQSLYDPLYRAKPQGGQPDPWLAEKTEVSSDGKLWTLTLRKGVKFHDGTDFDAAALKTNIEIRQQHRTFSLKAQIAVIKEVKVVNANTAQFVLSQPAPSLQTVLSSPNFGMYSPTAWTKFSDPAAYAKNATGTGPFKLDGVPTDSKIPLIRNEQYWGEKPYLDKLVFLVIVDTQARQAALEAGEIQIMDRAFGPDFDALAKSGKIKLQPTATSEESVMFWANQAKKPWNDVRVRQAMVHALNVKTYLPSLYGFGELSTSVATPNLVGHAPQPLYAYDPDKAKSLLAAAGVKPGVPIEFIVSSGYPYFTDIASLMKQDLDRVGFVTQIKQGTQAAYQAATLAPAATATYDAALAGMSVPYADAESVLFGTFSSANDAPKGNNGMHYKNPEVDRLLTEQSMMTDQAARLKVLAQIQKIVWDDVARHPIMRHPLVYGLSPKVRNVAFVTARPYMYQAWLAE